MEHSLVWFGWHILYVCFFLFGRISVVFQDFANKSNFSENSKPERILKSRNRMELKPGSHWFEFVT